MPSYIQKYSKNNLYIKINFIHNKIFSTLFPILPFLPSTLLIHTGWIELNVGDVKKGIEIMTKLASDEENEDGALAASLLDLFFFENKELEMPTNEIQENISKIEKLIVPFDYSIHVECTKRLKNAHTEEGFINLNKLDTVRLHHFHKKRVYQLNKNKNKK